VVGSGSKQDATGTTNTLPIPFSAPAGPNDQILVVASSQNNVALATPSGYSVVGTYVCGSGSGANLTVLFQRKATGGESGVTLSYTPNSGTVTSWKAANAIIYRGVDPFTPIDVKSVSSCNLNAVTTVTAPSLTTTRANDRLVMLSTAVGNVTTGTWTPPSGMTDQVPNGGHLTSGADIADQALGAPGSTGSRTATYSSNAILIGLLVALQPPSGFLYYHQDQLGSTRALTEPAGNVVATFTYDPYGRLTGSTGTVTTPFGFAGEYADAESGLTYLRNRYYDPATGQFLSRDPIEPITHEAYSYVNDNPLNGIDPSGLLTGKPDGGANNDNFNSLTSLPAASGTTSGCVPSPGNALPWYIKGNFRASYQLVPVMMPSMAIPQEKGGFVDLSGQFCIGICLDVGVAANEGGGSHLHVGVGIGPDVGTSVSFTRNTGSAHQGAAPYGECTTDGGVGLQAQTSVANSGGSLGAGVSVGGEAGCEIGYSYTS